jgi:hypothetical protein
MGDVQPWSRAHPAARPLTQPSTEDWYVHAAARAGAKQLLLARGAARAIFDRMAASRDPDDRDYAAADLLEVARIEPRAVPADLARKLARDQDRTVATRAAELLCVMEAVKEEARKKIAGTTTAISGCDGPVSSLPHSLGVVPVVARRSTATIGRCIWSQSGCSAGSDCSPAAPRQEGTVDLRRLE